MANEELKPKPKPEDFGWYNQVGFDDIPSGWMYEGGDEAYKAALKEWNEISSEDSPFLTGLRIGKKMKEELGF